MAMNVGFGRLSVNGFRRLNDITIDFKDRPLTVMIGANGTGKTSVLQAFSLFAGASSGTLRSCLSELGGIANVLTRGRATRLSLGIEGFVRNQSPMRYQLEITPGGSVGGGYEIAHESLTEQINPNAPSPFKYIESNGIDIRYFEPGTERLVKPTWQHEPLETSLYQIPKMYERPEAFRRKLASFSLYGRLDVGGNSPIQLPQSIAPVKIPKADGDETVSALYDLRESNSARYESVEDTLRAVFPDFIELRFPPVASGKISLTWRDGSFGKPFFVNELSEGTLRFLWLCTILSSEELPQILVFDEPEVSLHPAMLHMLVELLREAAMRTQVIVATHSERLLSFLQPKEVLVFDLEDGQARVGWADEKEDLSEWLKDYNLADLWSMNIFGGRP